MTTLNPLEQAAIPTAIAAIQAFQAFDTAMGTDPLLWPSKYIGSKLIFVGTLSNLVPGLLVAEGGALQTAITTETNGWITTLKAAQTPAAPAA